MLTTRRHTEEENVDAEERLAAYAVTRVLSGHGRTDLPITPPAPVQLRPVQERRSQARLEARLEVCASHPGAEGTVDGFTKNVSLSGVQLLMPEPPTDANQDLLVSDDWGTSVLWVQILQFRFVPEEDAYAWHVEVVAADDDWMPLLRRLVLPPE